MENLSALWIFLGIAILIVGPGGAAWVGSRGAVKILAATVREIKADLVDIRDWLKSLERRTIETDGKVRELKAVQEDRDRRRVAEGGG